MSNNHNSYKEWLQAACLYSGRKEAASAQIRLNLVWGKIDLHSSRLLHDNDSGELNPNNLPYD
jgi:hypothetical protein